MEKYFRQAIANVTRHGDTDIFPFPVENHVFFDRVEETVTHQSKPRWRRWYLQFGHVPLARSVMVTTTPLFRRTRSRMRRSKPTGYGM